MSPENLGPGPGRQLLVYSRANASSHLRGQESWRWPLERPATGQHLGSPLSLPQRLSLPSSLPGLFCSCGTPPQAHQHSPGLLHRSHAPTEPQTHKGALGQAALPHGQTGSWAPAAVQIPGSFSPVWGSRLIPKSGKAWKSTSCISQWPRRPARVSPPNLGPHQNSTQSPRRAGSEQAGLATRTLGQNFVHSPPGTR